MSAAPASTSTAIPIEWPTWGIVIAVVVPVVLIILFVVAVVALCVTCYCIRKRRLYELTHPNVHFPRPRDASPQQQPPNSARILLTTTADFSQPGVYSNPSLQVTNGALEQSRPNGNAPDSAHVKTPTVRPPDGFGTVAPPGSTWNAPIRPPKHPGVGNAAAGGTGFGQRDRHTVAMGQRAPQGTGGFSSAGRLEVGSSQRDLQMETGANRAGGSQQFSGGFGTGPRIIA